MVDAGFGSGGGGATLTQIQTELDARLLANNFDSLGLTNLLTSGASAKGAYTQLTAATVRKYTFLSITLYNANSITVAGADYLDISIGALGQEVVLIPDIEFYVLTLAGEAPALDKIFKCNIPSGTRITARIMRNLVTDNVRISVKGIG